MCAVLALAFARVVAAQPASGPPTFSREIAPIVFEQCAPCHRDGGDAPFSLTSYADVRRRAATIRAVVSQRYMPPWKPVPGVGDFLGARRLSDREIRLLMDWADAGTPLGDAAQMPEVPAVPVAGNPPDLVLTLPEYTLRADGPDVFRNFVVPVPIGQPRFVRGLRFSPRNPAVHHANIRVDSTAASDIADRADPLPGYEGLVLSAADYPDGHFLGWTPGQVEPALNDDLAWRLQPGSFLVIQMHLRPTGRVERLAPTIGLYFGPREATHLPTMIRLGRQNLSIAPGDRRHVVRDSFVLPVDVEVRALQPHAHYRARAVRAWARTPAGEERALLRIDDWDVNWQDRYVYRTPLHLPAGTTLGLEFIFDNSSANVRNPIVPAERAEWGWRSIDEMADLWIQVMTQSDRDRQRLAEAARVKMQTEDAIGGEQVLAREPNHADLRNDVATIYMALGQPEMALAHFRHVTRLRPGSAASHYNAGVALEALGQSEPAAERYREAISLQPAYASAHNNLGALLLRAGRPAEARPHFEHAVAADASNVDARANYATTLMALGAPDAAVPHMDAVFAARPSRLRALSPLIVWLAAHADPFKRRPADARRLAEQLMAIEPTPDAIALDTLAVALAAGGDFAAAISHVEAALRLLPGNAAERALMQQRLLLYQRGQPFVLPGRP